MSYLGRLDQPGRILRAAVLTAHVLLGVLLALAVLPMPPRLRAQSVRKLGPWWLRRGAVIVGLRVLARGRPAPGPVLLLANHISWLDILALATQTDAGFVAKAEVGHWPVLGWLARMGGTEFVQRGSHAGLPELLKRLTLRLLAGETLMAFPEGTSTASVTPGRFRPRLLQAAIDAGVPVQPVAIYYGAAPEELAQVAFVGEQTFLRHLWQLLGSGPVVAEVSFLPPLSSVTGDGRLLADEAWRAVTHTLTQSALYEGESSHSVVVPGADLSQAVSI